VLLLDTTGYCALQGVTGAGCDQPDFGKRPIFRPSDELDWEHLLRCPPVPSSKRPYGRLACTLRAVASGVDLAVTSWQSAFCRRVIRFHSRHRGRDRSGL